MFRRLFLPIFGLALIAAPSSHATIVAYDNTATYTSTPADDFGFRNVGTVFNSIAGFDCSGVYLGDGWMISAYHNVSNGAGGFTFGNIGLAGQLFAADVSTALRLHNPDNSLTDLAIFRLTTIPANLPSITIADAAAPLDTAVRMAGNGRNRLTGETRWQVVGGVWTEVPAGGNAIGYHLDPTGSRAMRWGINTLETSPASFPGTGFGTAVAFTTNFGDNTLSAVPGEAQATAGDSGGGVFWKTGGAWELGGIILANNSYGGQPNPASIFGTSTYSADLATYKDEIEDAMLAVPEPQAAFLLVLGAGLCLRRRRPALR